MTVPGPGIYHDVPARVYHDHALWPFHSRSDLGLILKSPAHYLAAKENPPEPTPAMKFGTLCHTAVLQPELLWKENAIPPLWNAKTKKGKEERDFWLATNTKNVITQGDADKARRIANAVWADPHASYLLGLGQREVSAVWQHPQTGLLCRVRADVIDTERNLLLVDFKTAADARPEAFSKAMYRDGLYRQGPFYMDGFNAAHGEEVVTRFVFVVVEKIPPFAVATYVLEAEDVERGREQNELGMKKLKWCMDNDAWPGYSAKTTPIGLPRWARHELDRGLPE